MVELGTRPAAPASDPELPREATRARLVAAGLELFGRMGYDAVTTRMLAATAGVNQAAIPYHFGGKEGVYLAVARHLCETSGEEVKREIARTRAAPGEAPGPDAAARQLAGFVGALVRIVLARDPGLRLYAFFTREQLNPSAAFDLVYRDFLEPAHRLVCELVGSVTGALPEDRETLLLAHAFLGQVSGFASGKATLLRRLGEGSEDYREEEIEAIGAVVERFCLAAALGLAGGQQMPNELDGRE